MNSLKFALFVITAAIVSPGVVTMKSHLEEVVTAIKNEIQIVHSSLKHELEIIKRDINDIRKYVKGESETEKPSSLKDDLMHACENSSLDVVKDSLDNIGVETMQNLKDKNGRSCIHVAAQNRHFQMVVFLLLSKWPVDQQDADGRTALHWSGAIGDRDTVEALLAYSASTNIKDNNGDLPIHLGVSSGNRGVVNLIANNLEARDHRNMTPAAMAAMNRDFDMFCFLLTLGADHDPVYEYGNRSGGLDPDIAEFMKGTKKCIINRDDQDFLLGCEDGGLTVVMYTVNKRGVEQAIHITNREDYSGMHLAAKYGRDNVVDYMLKQNWPVDQQGPHLLTPLHMATWGGHISTVSLLLRSGAKVDAVTEFGERSIHIAARTGHIQVAQVLLKSGAGLNNKDMFGETPLHTASRLNRDKMVRFLLSIEADAGVTDNSGRTPLQLAKENGADEAVQALEEYESAHYVL